MSETLTLDQLPGLDCGLCGCRTCSDLHARLGDQPELIRRCIPLSGSNYGNATVADQPVVNLAAGSPTVAPIVGSAPGATACGSCASASTATPLATPTYGAATATTPGLGTQPYAAPRFTDTLGRPFDFYLEHFPEDPGPREIMIPHNPMITRELDVTPGDILIGRPLGMSCGCPITHCGIVREVDRRTGVIVWCVTGPLDPRRSGFKDLGYYIAEAYEGMVTETATEIRIGARYFFQPRMCMLQWRHSGLVNYVNRTPTGLQIRLEGLWIG